MYRLRELFKRRWFWLPCEGSGQSAVELALALPMLLLLLCGAIDLGRVYYYQITITDAAREGVRAASNPAKSDVEVRTAAQNEASSTITLAASDITISPSPTRISGQPVTVTVSYGFTAITPVVDRMLNNGPLTLSTSAAAVVQ